MKADWPLKEAKKVLTKHKDLSKPILFETGYGPSGLPHIGTFAEVARTCFVIDAVKSLEPSAVTNLTVFSDDMDGLRQVPQNVPNRSMLSKHLGKPLSDVPDPFDEDVSFAATMNNRLRKFLNSFGFDYTLMSSTETYASGTFDRGLKVILDHYDEVKAVFTATISEEKREQWSPFFVRCENCLRIYSTRVTAQNSAEGSIGYICDTEGEGFSPCGFSGYVPVTGGRTKVGWKIDWALRWYTFGVDYEMYGKDLIDSVSVSSKIIRIMGASPPITYKYELFHDERGQKISKKLGNGISLDQWLRFSPYGALLFFLLYNPNKPRNMGLPILPGLIDDFLKNAVNEDVKGPEGAEWYLRRFVEKGRLVLPSFKTELSYSLLVNLAENLAVVNPDLLFGYACRHSPAISGDEVYYRSLCEMAVRYVEEFQKTQPVEEVIVDEQYIPLLILVKNFLLDESPEKQLDGEQVQSFLFAVAREHEVQFREWFGFLYASLLGKSRGPKLGAFFAALGRDESIGLIERALVNHGTEGEVEIA